MSTPQQDSVPESGNLTQILNLPARHYDPLGQLTFSYSHLSSPTWIRQLHCSIEYGYSCACSVCVATKQTLETLKQINEVYNVEEVAASTRDVYAKEYKGSESIFVDARDALWCSHPDCEGRRPLPGELSKDPQIRVPHTDKLACICQSPSNPARHLQSSPSAIPALTSPSCPAT